MKLHYYMKNHGGIGKEFIIWDDEKPEKRTADGFKLVKSVEPDIDEVTWPMIPGARYLKDT